MIERKKYYPWVYFKDSREEAIYRNREDVPRESADLMGIFVTRKNIISKLTSKNISFNISHKEIEREYRGKFIPFENKD